MRRKRRRVLSLCQFRCELGELSVALTQIFSRLIAYVLDFLDQILDSLVATFQFSSRSLLSSLRLLDQFAGLFITDRELRGKSCLLLFRASQLGLQIGELSVRVGKFLLTLGQLFMDGR